MYDFNLETGDTIWYEYASAIIVGYEGNPLYLEETPHYKVVVEKDSVLLENGQYRKRLILDSYLEQYGNLYIQTSWVEGIGSIDWLGLINPVIVFLFDNGDQFQFVCFMQDNEVLYLDNPYCDDCLCSWDTLFYHPFPESNAAWHTVGENLFTEDTWSFRYAVYGDTVINSVEYSKIYEMRDTIIVNPKDTYFAAIRENDNKQVFALITGFSETMLYDFSLRVGDTIWYDIGGALHYDNVKFWEQTHYKVVAEIDSVLLENDQYRKSWLLEGSEWGETTWVEGVGSIDWYGLFNPLISNFTESGDSYQFACFKQNDTILYLDNPFGDGCFCGFITTSIKTTDTGKTNILTLFPNPAKDLVTVRINSDHLTNYKLIITNIAGIKIVERSINIHRELNIDLSNFKSGLYLFQIFDEKGVLLDSEKLIVE